MLLVCVVLLVCGVTDVWGDDCGACGVNGIGVCVVLQASNNTDSSNVNTTHTMIISHTSNTTHTTHISNTTINTQSFCGILPQEFHYIWRLQHQVTTKTTASVVIGTCLLRSRSHSCSGKQRASTSALVGSEIDCPGQIYVVNCVNHIRLWGMGGQKTMVSVFICACFVPS